MALPEPGKPHGPQGRGRGGEILVEVVFEVLQCLGWSFAGFPNLPEIVLRMALVYLYFVYQEL